MEKITVLLYSLAIRLAKTEFEIKDETCLFLSKRQLEEKRERLKSQLEEAKYLKALIDKRTMKVIHFLTKYLNTESAKEFYNILNEKMVMIVELKEIKEKECLGKIC